MCIEELFQRFNDYADTSKQYLDTMLYNFRRPCSHTEKYQMTMLRQANF